MTITKLSSNQKQTAIWCGVALAIAFLLSLLGPILMPFIVAATLAYVLNPWVDRLCAWRVKGWQLPRSVAACVVIFLMITVVLAVVLIMVPILQKQIPQLQNQIPQFLNKFNAFAGPLLSDLGIHTSFDSDIARLLFY